MKETYRMTAEIDSVVGEGEQRETYRMTLPARLDITGGSHTLSFTEVREGVKIFTTLSYTPSGHRVHMKCRGGIKSEIVFDPREVHVSTYEVKPLAFTLTVQSREVSVSLDEGGGEICLSYTRALEGDVTPVTYRLRATPEVDV